MKYLLSLLAAGMLIGQMASAQVMGNLAHSPLTGTHRDIAIPEGDGFKAEYYNGANFEHKVFTRIDKTIDFYLVNRSPAKGILSDRFSVRWTGKLYAPQTGTYVFLFFADDAVRFWVNNKLIINEWGLNQPSKFYGKIALQGNQVYDLKIEYAQMMPQHAVARATWRIDNGPEEPFDSRYVFSSTGKVPSIAVNTPKPAPATKTPTGDKPPQQKTVSKPVSKQPNPDKTEPAPKLTSAPTKVKKTPPAKPIEKAPEPVVTQVKKEVPAETFDNLEIGKSIVLEHIFFDQSKHELRPESFTELDKLANTLQKYPQLQITITGHTDNVGDFNLNVQLSKERAKAVAEYLVAQGIDKNRIEHKGYGGLYPVAPNISEENKKKNRRVEFAVR